MSQSLVVSYRQRTYLLAGPSIFVATLPQALPAMLQTVSLCFGQRQMARQKSIIQFFFSSHIQLKYLWNDWCCLPEATACRLVCNHTLSHSVTWCLDNNTDASHLARRTRLCNPQKWFISLLTSCRQKYFNTRSPRLYNICAFFVILLFLSSSFCALNCWNGHGEATKQLHSSPFYQIGRERGEHKANLTLNGRGTILN